MHVIHSKLLFSLLLIFKLALIPCCGRWAFLLSSNHKMHFSYTKAFFGCWLHEEGQGAKRGFEFMCPTPKSHSCPCGPDGHNFSSKDPAHRWKLPLWFRTLGNYRPFQALPISVMSSCDGAAWTSVVALPPHHCSRQPPTFGGSAYEMGSLLYLQRFPMYFRTLIFSQRSP